METRSHWAVTSFLLFLYSFVGTYSALKSKDALITVCAAIALDHGEKFLVLQLQFPRHSLEPLFGVGFFPLSTLNAHHSTLLSSAEHWRRTIQGDFLLRLEHKSSIGSYLQRSSRPDARQVHCMKVVVQMPLKHWQVWDTAHLSSSPLPVLVHWLSK